MSESLLAGLARAGPPARADVLERVTREPARSALRAAGPFDAMPDVRPDLAYQPILDVARGGAAGYQARVREPQQAASAAGESRDVHGAQHDAPPVGLHSDERRSAAVATAALSAFATLPANTFLSLPIGLGVAASPHVRTALLSRGSLRGVVLDIVSTAGVPATGAQLAVLDVYREAGALIAVGGRDTPQPELASIVRLRPAIIRLGRDWVRGVDESSAKRDAIEMIGQLAGRLDAWILADGVCTAAELRVLAGLDVPLAQGPFIGHAQRVWPDIGGDVQAALPVPTGDPGGVLRGLLQQAHTTTDAAATTRMLPGTAGWDVVIVLDDAHRPTALLEHGARGWAAFDLLAVNVETPVGDAVARAMARPRSSRFTPLACTDDAGRFLGVLRLERLISHLAAGA